MPGLKREEFKLKLQGAGKKHARLWLKEMVSWLYRGGLRVFGLEH